MRLSKSALLTLFLAASSILSPVFAHAQQLTKCVTSPLMVGKPLANAISQYVQKTLTARGWTGVVVEIKALKLLKKHNVQGTDLVDTYDWADTLSFVEGSDFTQKIAIEGRFGERLLERAELDCHIPLAARARAFVSGTYVGSDGKSVSVKKAPLDLSGLEVPGRQLLSDGK